MKIDRRARARPAPPRVALVIETSTSFGRKLHCGVAAYIRENGPWSVYFGERAVFDPPPDWLKRWSGDGIISRIASPDIRRIVKASRVPVVDLNEQLGDLGAPQISIDHAAVGRMAARHLLERGFTRFGFLGHVGQRLSERRRDAFAAEARAAGFECDDYKGRPIDLRALRQGSWELELDRIAKWVAGLPQPVGILACHDFRALQLLAACRLADVATPEQAAVIGVGADDVACELADPPLSSVVLNAWRMGYEAAAQLDRLMKGERPTAREVLIPPLEVAARQSTDVTAIGDPVVARAMRFIRERACEGVNVEEVVRSVGMSRTALQDHFRATLGRSIHDVVVETRIARVRELLGETTLSLQDIAERTGFKYPEYMSSVLKQRTGWTPARYRAEHGARRE
jgi:LacI family transcriptional regulator